MSKYIVSLWLDGYEKASKILGLTRTGLVEKRRRLGLKLNPAPRG